MVLFCFFFKDTKLQGRRDGYGRSYREEWEWSVIQIPYMCEEISLRINKTLILKKKSLA